MNLFSNLYDVVMYPLEQLKLKSIRKRLLKDLQGRILEIGAGTGANFSFYPQGVYVRAIEPDPAMAKIARGRAAKAKANIEVVEGKGEKLFCPDNTYDYAVATLVLCSVEDPLQVVRELYRVLKPGGKLILFEHVRVKDRFWARVQDKLTPTWSCMCGNCHLNRNTEETIRSVFGDITTKYYFKNIFVEIHAQKK